MNHCLETMQQLAKKLSLIAQGMALAEKYADSRSGLPLHLRNEGEVQVKFYQNAILNTILDLNKYVKEAGLCDIGQ